MATFLTIFFAGIGMAFLFSPMFPVSIGFFLAAYAAWRHRTLEDEERFIAVLAALAFLGVVMLLIEDAIGRWLLS